MGAGCGGLKGRIAGRKNTQIQHHIVHSQTSSGLAVSKRLVENRLAMAAGGE